MEHSNRDTHYETGRATTGGKRANMKIPQGVDAPQPDGLTPAERRYRKHLEQELDEVDKAIAAGEEQR